jgi:hypothetical protein
VVLLQSLSSGLDSTFCLFFYPQDPKYTISHSIWNLNILTNKSTPQNKNFQFTAIPTLTPVLKVDKVGHCNAVQLCIIATRLLNTEKWLCVCVCTCMHVSRTCENVTTNSEK